MSDQSHKLLGMERSTWLRIVAVAIIVGLGVLYEITHRLLWQYQTNSVWIALERLLLFANGVLAFYFVDRFLKWRQEKRDLERQLELSAAAIDQAEKRQTLLFEMSSRFADINDERGLIDLVLELSREVIGADGASFVPLDERAQPLPSMTVGEIPFPLPEPWLEYLASPGVRQRCASCNRLEMINYQCPLITGTFVETKGVYCVPIRRGGREYGILNLYMQTEQAPNANGSALLRQLVDEAAMIMESLRLHQREMSVLKQIQSVRENTDLSALLTKLMENLVDTLEADAALIRVDEDRSSTSLREVSVGELLGNAHHLVNAILDSVVSSGQLVSLGDVIGENASKSALRAMVGVPLNTPDGETIGALLVASHKTKPFNQRQLAMLLTIAGQVALVISNVHRMADMEYRVIMDERVRLSREIHDGLAQSLGFLKLKIAQVKGFMEKADYERIQETIPICYETVAESYQEVRQAIDGLRVDVDEYGLVSWLRRVVVEFEENMAFQVLLEEPLTEIDLAPEVHAQLIRILQEALNNARRHSGAKQAWVSCRMYANDFILDIRDDGTGFDVSSIPEPSQHGLQGMRERSELIGADFQVISLPGEGTTIRIRLPLKIGEETL